MSGCRSCAYRPGSSPVHVLVSSKPVGLSFPPVMGKFVTIFGNQGVESRRRWLHARIVQWKSKESLPTTCTVYSSGLRTEVYSVSGKKVSHKVFATSSIKLGRFDKSIFPSGYYIPNLIEIGRVFHRCDNNWPIILGHVTQYNVFESEQRK